MGPPAVDKKPEKTTLLGSMNPWGGSGRSTPTPGPAAADPATDATGTGATTLSSTTGPDPATGTTSTAPDHSTRPYYGRSFKRYPPGCPPPRVQWFHAVDSPKRKANWMGSKQVPQDTKPLAPAKKYVKFSANDSRSIEAAYQKELESFEDRDQVLPGSRSRGKSATDTSDVSDVGATSNKEGKENGGLQTKGSGVKVPVNEDFLFDVDIENRELAPVYWLGPVYDVRRGIWFYQEGSNLRACEENLAAQLEEGYLKAKPWLYPVREKQAAASVEVSKKESSENLKGSEAEPDATAPPSSVVASVTSVFSSATSSTTATGSGALDKTFHPESHRLFGQYMNHVATYQDENTAWLSTDSVLSWVTSTVYERFSGGGYMSGVKVVRGYSEPNKAKDDKEKAKDGTAKDDTRPGADSAEEKRLKALKRRSAPPSTSTTAGSSGADGKELWDDGSRTSTDKDKTNDNGSGAASEMARRSTQLHRQLSSLMGKNENRDPAQQAEEIRRRAEEEISDDYNAQSGESQGREIEHLFLVTHGIGQLLGLRMESLNFIHDVNTLRKTLKSVYSESKDLRALNSEPPEGPGNCRIQVLPVCWRHLLDFPRRRGESKKQEQDLSEMNEDEDEEEEYPALDDITVEGVAFARSLISDLALDVLLYQSAYREQIAEIVLSESNRIHSLFLERNPGFKGTVHIIGHSLGSAIMFDLLCQQKEKKPDAEEAEPYRNPLSIWPSTRSKKAKSKSATVFDEDEIEGASASEGKKSLEFNFDVQDLFCLGSPIGLFQMLKGRTIAARHLLRSPQAPDRVSSLSSSAVVSSLADNDNSPYGFESSDDTFMTAPSTTATDQRVSTITGMPLSVSSPKVGQLFNIFHPSDPISYRLEPLIAPAMKSLKPQPLPYTKKGLFGSVAPQGLTDIGAKVGQSFSGLWSSFQAGITTNILNRSLGLTAEDVSKLNQQEQKQIAAGDEDNSANDFVADEEVETLFSHFEKKRADMAKESTKDSKAADKDSSSDESREARAARWRRDEAKARRMRREEAKVRALNRNGRVDFHIQEGVMDFNPINTIASHLTYWADADVSHFMMTQVFAGKLRAAKAKKGNSSEV
ncbi:DDHD domain-containing protein [Sporothrix brasiliensis 5110]|uniref:DDHD domain-containing protein n=1 Tax=Sporothrix brasiliensis 5110 TaxID=1398154 RepID=A0A0C2IMB2_9PEZI|nr:DDHD domain-containing protein [Sporothrix brasiliensis 5110]KIH88150.1 DDHD domain-containing protein [Sporothrix brasiliensis 5110]